MLYHQRWEIESVLDELKTHLRQGRRVLRSKTTELVRQEFFGWVLAHYAVRWLPHQRPIGPVTRKLKQSVTGRKTTADRHGSLEILADSAVANPTR